MRYATGSAAAVSMEMPSGTCASRSADTVASVAKVPGMKPNTASPGFKCVTPGPIASITPEHSLPSRMPAPPGYAPSASRMSRKFSPDATIRTRASLGPGPATFNGCQASASNVPASAGPQVRGLCGASFNFRLLNARNEALGSSQSHFARLARCPKEFGGQCRDVERRAVGVEINCAAVEIGQLHGRRIEQAP